jgi:hypothetical protein
LAGRSTTPAFAGHEDGGGSLRDWIKVCGAAPNRALGTVSNSSFWPAEFHSKYTLIAKILDGRVIPARLA